MAENHVVRAAALFFAVLALLKFLMTTCNRPWRLGAVGLFLESTPSFFIRRDWVELLARYREDGALQSHGVICADGHVNNQILETDTHANLLAYSVQVNMHSPLPLELVYHLSLRAKKLNNDLS
jgi:hypothetical protein